MKKQNTQTQSKAEAEPTDEAFIIPQMPLTVAYNRDTRHSDEQATNSKYVIARAQRIATRSKRFAMQAATHKATLKDFAVDPDFQDVYTFSIGPDLQAVATDALNQAILALGFTAMYVKTPVKGTANGLILIGETPEGTQAYFIALQSTTKHAIESFLNLDIQVTSYDGWTPAGTGILN